MHVYIEFGFADGFFCCILFVTHWHWLIEGYSPECQNSVAVHVCNLESKEDLYLDSERLGLENLLIRARTRRYFGT